MSEMVERVAKAIAEESPRDGYEAVPLSEIWPGRPRYIFLREGYERAARAAIAAMREPTPEMSEAMFRVEAAGHSQRTLCEAAWRAAIDEALKD